MKNTMSLENYGVAEMTTREMETANGGYIWWFSWRVRDYYAGYPTEQHLS